MNKIVPIEANMPHKVSEVICVFCGHRWISARPCVTLLKNCLKTGGVIETGQDLDVKEE